MIRRAAVGVIFLLAVPALSPGADDWKMWNNYSFKLPVIEKKVDLNGIFETRFRDDMDEFYRYHFYVGPDYYFRKWLTLGVQYGNIQSGDPGEFHTEHRFMYFLTPKFKLSDLGVKESPLSDLSVSLQNRLDWRIRYFKDHVNTWQYRIYPKISYPVYEGKHLKISPYVADAFYFNLTDGIDFNQNRIYGGLTFGLFKKLNLDFYYMRLAERSSVGAEWVGSHVLGTGVAYNF